MRSYPGSLTPRGCYSGWGGVGLAGTILKAKTQGVMGRGLASSSKTARPPHIAPEGQQPAKRRWGSSSAICNFQRGISRQRARTNVFKIPVTTTSPKESTPPREEQARARGDPRGGCPGPSRRRATASAAGTGRASKDGGAFRPT